MTAAATPREPKAITCPDGTLVGDWAGARKLVPAKCRRWACKECGPKKARALARRITKSPATRFLTLTVRQDETMDPQEQLDAMNAGWRALWKRIKREQGPKARGYVRIVELTKKGTPHLHLAVCCGYIHQATLSRWWEEITDSPVVDIRRVRTGRGLARYLAKYLTKAHERVTNRRKWSSSKDFLPADEPPEKTAVEQAVTWQWLPRDLIGVELALQNAGWREVTAGIWIFGPQLEPW